VTGLVVVTGASSGIGRAFAQRFGAEGYDLLVVGRRRDRLEELVAALPDVEVRPMVADLGTDTGVAAVAGACAAAPVTILVNNAGVAHYMPFAELPAGKARLKLTDSSAHRMMPNDGARPSHGAADARSRRSARQSGAGDSRCSCPEQVALRTDVDRICREECVSAVSLLRCSQLWKA
jgi:NAD(P)-dependent dehydrogenase (short-subunit alcohol dehydrogenase family)